MTKMGKTDSTRKNRLAMNLSSVIVLTLSKYKKERRQQIEEELRRRAKLSRWVAVIATVVVLSAGAVIWHRNENALKVDAISFRTSTDEKWTPAAMLALKHLKTRMVRQTITTQKTVMQLGSTTGRPESLLGNNSQR